MEPTEAELIAAVLRGDAASFEPLVQKYSPRVFATARRYARRESEVEDIAQEVWLKAFSKLSSFRAPVLRTLPFFWRHGFIHRVPAWARITMSHVASFTERPRGRTTRF